jgi:hypothetical protein
MSLARKAKGLCALILAGFMAPVSAANVEITATFQPDPANPMRNEFVNKTPQGGYCGDHPDYCENGVFSLALPIRFRAIADIQALNDERQGAMFRVPSSWRDVRVIHDETGEEDTVRIRVNGIGAAYTTKKALPEDFWPLAWVYAPPPCQYGGVGYGNHLYFAFFWRVPVDAGVCSKQAQKLIDQSYDFSYQDMGFSYQLVTPNPLKMTAGTYRGVLSYTVGPGRDFDMGDVMLPDDNLISIDFTLNVQHTMKVEIPPGGNKVLLEPQGGWRSWLEHGRKPVRLYRDQTFNISASSKFKMKLECEVDLETGCGIRDRVSGYGGVVSVSVSLPGGLTDSSGQPVRRMPLSRTNSQPFQPGIYVDRKPGTLHFEMDERATSWLINNSKDRPYQGNITVIWDSEV